MKDTTFVFRWLDDPDTSQYSHAACCVSRRWMPVLHPAGLRQVHANDPAKGTRTQRRANPAREDRGADVGQRHGPHGGRQAQDHAPGAIKRRGFPPRPRRSLHSWFPDESRWVQGRPLSPQPGLGWDQQHVLLDRSASASFPPSLDLLERHVRGGIGNGRFNGRALQLSLELVVGPCVEQGQFNWIEEGSKELARRRDIAFRDAIQEPVDLLAARTRCCLLLNSKSATPSSPPPTADQAPATLRAPRSATPVRRVSGRPTR
jgi:hypothetical protein